LVVYKGSIPSFIYKIKPETVRSQVYLLKNFYKILFIVWELLKNFLIVFKK